MIKKLLLISLITTSIYAESCWTSVELSRFAFDELDNKATLSIKDSVSCKPISNADLYLGNMKFRTNSKGLVRLPLPPENMHRKLPITIKKKGYITSKEKVFVSLGLYWNKQFLMSKELPLQSARFVLSWGKTPRDLDLHLVSKSYHISYRNTVNIPNKVRLDKDTRNGYGAETITLDKLDTHNEYKVLIYNFSNHKSIDNKVKIQVYLNNKLNNIVNLPNTQERCLEVATIKNNIITYKTKISNQCK